MRAENASGYVEMNICDLYLLFLSVTKACKYNHNSSILHAVSALSSCVYEYPICPIDKLGVFNGIAPRVT